MDRKEAFRLLAINYVEQLTAVIGEDEQKFIELLTKTMLEADNLITPIMEVMQREIKLSEELAFIAAQYLFIVMDRIDEAGDEVTANDCKFTISDEDQADVADDWKVYIAENAAERGMYEAMGEQP